METEIITIYCIVDEYFQGINHQEDPQTQVNDAAIMTTAIGAAVCHGGILHWPNGYSVHPFTLVSC